MVNPFQLVAERLGELGVYNFLLPWLITTALIWGLLKKSQIFGENAAAINSVISISVSFFIWGFIVFTGGEIATSLSSFFAQMVFVGIGFLVILLVGSLFFPDFTEKLRDAIPGSTMFWIVVVIGIILAVGVGLINVGGVIFNLLKSFSGVPGGDVGLLIVAFVVLVLLVALVSST